MRSSVPDGIRHFNKRFANFPINEFFYDLDALVALELRE
jgi:hypothetical protein